MNKRIKYRLMSGILAGTLLISGFKNNIMKASASSIETPNVSTISLDTEAKSESLEEYLESIENNQVKKFYKQLYDLYDYETFQTRSIIPQYFQTIYGNKFSCGTIQSAGCGISSLAMVSSYLFDEIITPDMMTIYDSGPSPASAFEKGIRSLKLNCEIHRGQAAIDNVDRALDSRHPVIALVGGGSIFTEKGHFIVLAGKTADGKYIVNDPNLENFYKPSLIDGFTNGFTRDEITAGLRGIYIFDTKENFIDRRTDRKLSIKTNTSKQNKPEASEPYIGYTKTETSLRTYSSDTHSIIKNLDINTSVIKLYSNNGWDLVRCNGYTGYIRTKDVSYTQELSTAFEYQHYKRNDIVLTLSEIELKAAPKTTSKKISTINKDSEVQVIAALENGWLAVRYNGKTGYIENKNIVSLLEEVQNLYPELQLSELNVKSIVYLTEDSNIRCGNKIDFPAVDVLEKYETVRVLGEYDNWYFVLTNEREFGFILKKYTKEIDNKTIVVDKSQSLVTLFVNNEEIYKITGKSINMPKDGFYSVLNKKRGLLLFDTSIGWNNVFSNPNYDINNAMNEIQNSVELGDKILFHK